MRNAGESRRAQFARRGRYLADDAAEESGGGRGIRIGAERARVKTRLVAFALLAVLVATLTACTNKERPGLRVPDPGSCTPVDVAATGATAPLLAHAAGRFNGSAASRLPGGECAFVRVQ